MIALWNENVPWNMKCGAIQDKEKNLLLGLLQAVFYVVGGFSGQVK